MKYKRVKNMNEYERVKTMNDSRWNNTLKYEVFKNLTDLEDFEKQARNTKIAAIRQKEKKTLNNLKNFKKINDAVKKEANDNVVSKIAKITHNRKLLKMSGNVHPNKIKLNIRHSIVRINDETNKLITLINKKEKQLENLQNSLCVQLCGSYPTNKNFQRNRIMGKLLDVERQITLVNFMNRKTEKIVESQSRSLQQFNLIFEQLINDVVSTSTSLVREIEIIDSIRADIKTYDKKFIMDNRVNEKSIDIANTFLAKFNYIIESLELNR